MLFRTRSTCIHSPSVANQPVQCWSGPAIGTWATLSQSSYEVLSQFIAFYRLYELESLFPGSLSHDIEEKAPFTANELFFTSSGRIGVLLDVTGSDSRLSMQLSALERNMAYVVQGIGGGNHTK
jgi:hypothetical protein